MIYRTCRRMTKTAVIMAKVTVAQREAKKIVKLRKKRKVVIGKVRKRRMGMKKTIQRMKTRRTEKVPSVVVAVSCCVL